MRKKIFLKSASAQAHYLSACRAFAIHLLHNVVDTKQANLVPSTRKLHPCMDRLEHNKRATICRCRPGNCKDRQKKRCPSHPGSACKVDMIRPAVHPLSRFIPKPDLVASDAENMWPLRPHRPLPGCAQPTQQAPWILNQDAHDAQMDTIRKFLGCKPAKCNPN